MIELHNAVAGSLGTELVSCRQTKAMYLQPVLGMPLCGMLRVSACSSLVGRMHIDG